MDIRKIVEGVINRAEYQPGYPAWNKKQEIIKAGKIPGPGMQPGTTWCNTVANTILVLAGYDTRPLLDVYNNKFSIGFTTANEMYSNAVAAAGRGVIQEVTAEKAQELANQDIPVLVAAPGEKHGHVAIVMRCSQVYSPERGCYIAQAGSKNGFFFVHDIFQAPWVYPEKIKYFLLNKKK